MIIVAEYPHVKIYWYDEERTIIVGEVEKGWGWSDAQKGLQQLNETVGIQSQNNPVYVIISVAKDALSLPTDGSTLKNIRHLLRDDPSHETMTIYVAQANKLGNLINLTSRVYRIAHNKEKYRYVATLELALDIIESHKAQSDKG
jgi:hypothetical protein